MLDRSLADAAKLTREKMGIKGLRLMGDPATKITKVGHMPGYGQLPAMMRVIADADLVFTGEQREWEGLYYAHDAIASGRPKGEIVMGQG